MKDKKLQFLEDRIITEKNETIMMDWEHPLMRRHAEITCQNGGDILEIGFGMGISAQYIQEQDIDSHTIIEIHPEIAENAREWSKDKENVKIIESDWYDVMDDLETYDGVFYDTEIDLHNDQFYDLVKKILKNGGIYTFFNIQTDGMKNKYNINENIRYELIDISPPENSYMNSNVYYLPIIQLIN